MASLVGSSLSTINCTLAPYEAERDLTALHEGGVVTLEDDGWSLSPRIKVRIDDGFMHLAAETRDGCGLRLRTLLHIEADWRIG